MNLGSRETIFNHGIKRYQAQLLVRGGQAPHRALNPKWSTPQSDLYYTDLTNMFYIRKSG